MFNSDGTALLAIVKGDPSKPDAKRPGRVVVWGVDSKGNVASEGVTSEITELGDNLLFGSACKTAALATFANGDKALYKIEGQEASCWTTRNPSTKTVYVSDALTSSAYKIDPKAPGVVQTLDLLKSAGGPLAGVPIVGLPGDPVLAGLTDIEMGRECWYLLVPTDGCIVVGDVSGGRGKMRVKQVASGMATKRSAGMAVYFA
ncbi:hypothetical protein FOA52_007048 [Chlamydomonas sp. UWO 241]|nr:hypothetical protein FOA52_007048 [Chlamydomonas sp. UWO 241]